MVQKWRVIIITLGALVGVVLLALTIATVVRLAGYEQAPPPTLPLPTLPTCTDAAALSPTQDDLPQYRLEDGHDLAGPGNVSDAPRIAGYECLWSSEDPDTVAYGAFNVTARIELFQDEVASEVAYKQRVVEIKEAITTEGASGLEVAQEVAAPVVGRKATAYQLKGMVQDADGQSCPVVAYTVIFTRRNGVVTVTTMGYKDYRLLDDAVRLAQSVAVRLGSCRNPAYALTALPCLVLTVL
jgi:hypothetical protein